MKLFQSALCKTPVFSIIYLKSCPSIRDTGTNFASNALSGSERAPVLVEAGKEVSVKNLTSLVRTIRIQKPHQPFSGRPCCICFLEGLPCRFLDSFGNKKGFTRHGDLKRYPFTWPCKVKRQKNVFACNLYNVTLRTQCYRAVDNLTFF